jgi:hypothetical protein
MKRSNGIASAFTLIATIIVVLMISPTGDSYQGVDVETCGSAGTPPCHGEIDPGVVVTLDGPEVVETGEPVTFYVTITGGPSRTYGFFAVLSDPDGNSRDLVGDFLFELNPNSLTKVGDSNTFAVEFTPPRYAVDLTLKVSAVSTDDSGNPLGDGWNHAEKEIRVEYPTISEFPGEGIPQSAYLVGLFILVAALMMWVVFFFADRRVKKEVMKSGRQRRSG